MLIGIGDASCVRPARLPSLHPISPKVGFPIVTALAVELILVARHGAQPDTRAGTNVIFIFAAWGKLLAVALGSICIHLGAREGSQVALPLLLRRVEELQRRTECTNNQSRFQISIQNGRKQDQAQATRL